VTDLNRDHRERENVRFLAVWPLVQDLWRSPPWGEAALRPSVPDGIDTLSERSEAKVRDACTTGVVHKDVWLAGVSMVGKRRSKQPRTPLRFP